MKEVKRKKKKKKKNVSRILRSGTISNSYKTKLAIRMIHIKMHIAAYSLKIIWYYIIQNGIRHLICSYASFMMLSMH